MEREGFYAVYNAYERSVEDDVVTKSVITEKDIDFTVTEEYIALDCTKDNYVSLCRGSGESGKILMLLSPFYNENDWMNIILLLLQNSFSSVRLYNKSRKLKIPYKSQTNRSTK